MNMIVKNESDVICRCLGSVKDVIDYWVIIDTGSTDGTQKIIKDYLKDIPGELFERPWKNFSHNRNEALQLAKRKGDYILFMDADDVLEFEGEAKFLDFTADLCNMWRGTEDFSYIKPQLVRASLPWKWVGVTHEYLGCDKSYSSELLSYVKYVSKDGGATHKDPTKKFLTNVQLLTEGLKEEPDNVSYAFYLAESYRDAGEPGKALEWYQKRIAMGGWDEEIFCSKFQSALMLQRLGLPSNVVVEAFLHAHRYRPSRLEPIYYAADVLIDEGNYSKAYEYLKASSFIAKPSQKDSLFNMDWIEKYGILFQLSICSYYLGHYEESLKACDELLAMKGVPENWRQRTLLNREFPVAKLQEKLAAQ
ncbi:MAG: glycosyltransferase [Verrucomicrobiota bacterium]|nr:glycosyltransferase [Verrucomicrobiota bacterium]